MRRPLLIAAAVAGLVLASATPASAAPHGSAKPTTTIDSTNATLCGITGLTMTTTAVNISQDRASGTATPGAVTTTWSNDTGSVTYSNANLAITSESVEGDTLTLHITAHGVYRRVATSEGPQPQLTIAGNVTDTVVIDLVSGELISENYDVISGRDSVSHEAFCEAAVAALT